MSKKNFIRKIIESAGGGGGGTGWKSTSERQKEEEVFDKVSKILNSVENRAQLETALKVVNKFIEQYGVKEKSPEYVYLSRIFKMKRLKYARDRRKRSDDNEDLSERQMIRKILREELEDNWIDDGESFDGVRFKVINNYTANLSDIENPIWTIKDRGGDSVEVNSNYGGRNFVSKNGVNHYFSTGEWFQLPVNEAEEEDELLDEDSYWGNDEFWGTDNSHWGNDPQWGSEGGDYGGGDSGDSDDGGDDF